MLSPSKKTRSYLEIVKRRVKIARFRSLRKMFKRLRRFKTNKAILFKRRKFK